MSNSFHLAEIRGCYKNNCLTVLKIECKRLFYYHLKSSRMPLVDCISYFSKHGAASRPLLVSSELSPANKRAQMDGVSIFPYLK